MNEDVDLSRQPGSDHESRMNTTAQSVPNPGKWKRSWQYWTPIAAVAWSLIYAGVGLYGWVSGQGFPAQPGLTPSIMGLLAGRFGSVIIWIIVIAAGIPAVALGAMMMRGVRQLRSLLISGGILLAVILLLLMIDLNLLVTLAYIPYILFRLLTGAGIDFYLQMLNQSQWQLAQQLLCLVGGFLWLAATVSYARRSSDACLYCGRRDNSEGWTNPDNAAQWGRIAVYIAMVPPVIYAATRYAWAMGIPLGMSKEYFRQGQESGLWTSGLFLANFGLVGALLMLGLVQHWGEVFPRWLPGLAGRRVPSALAIIPASVLSVLLIVGGFTILSGFTQLASGAAATGQDIWIVVGPTLLFPVWGAALAVATLGYYYRRRRKCGICGRGAANSSPEPVA